MDAHKSAGRASSAAIIREASSCRSARAEDDNDLAFGDLEREALEGSGASFAGRVDPEEVGPRLRASRASGLAGAAPRNGRRARRDDAQRESSEGDQSDASSSQGTTGTSGGSAGVALAVIATSSVTSNEASALSPARR